MKIQRDLDRFNLFKKLPSYSVKYAHIMNGWAFAKTEYFEIGIKCGNVPDCSIDIKSMLSALKEIPEDYDVVIDNDSEVVFKSESKTIKVISRPSSSFSPSAVRGSCEAECLNNFFSKVAKLVKSDKYADFKLKTVSFKNNIAAYSNGWAAIVEEFNIELPETSVNLEFAKLAASLQGLSYLGFDSSDLTMWATDGSFYISTSPITDNYVEIISTFIKKNLIYSELTKAKLKEIKSFLSIKQKDYINISNEGLRFVSSDNNKESMLITDSFEFLQEPISLSVDKFLRLLSIYSNVSYSDKDRLYFKDINSYAVIAGVR